MGISVLIYGISFFISIYISFRYEKWMDSEQLNRKYMNEILWVLLIIMPVVLISTFRYGIGTDYFNYVRITEEIRVLPVDFLFTKYFYSTEPLFVLLTKISTVVFSNYVGFFFVSSFVINFLIVKSLMTYKIKSLLPFGLFISYMLHFSISLNIVRQMLAVSVVLYGLKFIYSKSKIKYIFCVLIATLFHNTAIFSLLFVFFIDWNIKVNERNLKNIIVLLYVDVILLSPILIYVGINTITTMEIFSQYTKYITTEINWNLNSLIVIFPIFFPLLINRKQLINKHPDLESLFYISFLVIPFRIIANFIEWGSRLTFYVELPFYILIPAMIFSFDKKENRVFYSFYYLFFFLLYYVYSYVISNSGEAYPYMYNF